MLNNIINEHMFVCQGESLWGQMGTNWGPTCSFLAKTEDFLS